MRKMKLQEGTHAGVSSGVSCGLRGGRCRVAGGVIFEDPALAARLGPVEAGCGEIADVDLAVRKRCGAAERDEAFLRRRGLHEAAEAKRAHRGALLRLAGRSAERAGGAGARIVLADRGEHGGAKSDVGQCLGALAAEPAKEIERGWVLHCGGEVGTAELRERRAVGARVALAAREVGLKAVPPLGGNGGLGFGAAHAASFGWRGGGFGLVSGSGRRRAVKRRVPKMPRPCEGAEEIAPCSRRSSSGRTTRPRDRAGLPRRRGGAWWHAAARASAGRPAARAVSPSTSAIAASASKKRSWVADQNDCERVASGALSKAVFSS